MIGPEPGATFGAKPPLLKRLEEFITELYHEERAMWNAHYRRYFQISARLLALGFILGFVYFMVRPAQETRALAMVMKALKDIPLGASPLVLALTIFYHNALASVIAVAAGGIPFLCLPVLDPLANGAVLGLLASISKHQGLNVPLLFLKSVAPHGIIELPAVLYATSVGIYLSVSLAKKLLAKLQETQGKMLSDLGSPSALGGREETDSAHMEAGSAKVAGDRGEGGDAYLGTMSPFLRFLVPAVRSFMIVVLPLLLVSAFIEAFVTPLLR